MQLRQVKEQFSYHRLLLFLTFLFLFMFGMLSILGVDLPNYGPNEYLTDEFSGRIRVFAPPSIDIPFGTDAKGYDVFSQFYYGLKTNIVFSLITAITFTLFGTFVGVRFGYYKKSTRDFQQFLDQDRSRKVRMLSLSTLRRFFIYHRRSSVLLSSHLVKSFNSIPILLFILFVAVILQNLHWIRSRNAHLAIVMVVFGLISAPKLANMIIGKIQSLRAEEFIQSSLVLGIPNWIIVAKHILWLECRYIILYQFAYIMGQASILEITLKYFNYGAFPPWISWGTTLVNTFEGRLHPNMIIPVLFITLTIYFYMGVAQELKRYGDQKEIQR